MKSSPLAQVKDKFKDKDSLVSAVRALATEELWVGRLDADSCKGGKGLDNVSNRKLLRLHEALSGLKKDFGTRKGAIDAILKTEKREKDAGFRARLESYPTPRLLDHARASKKRAKAAS